MGVKSELAVLYKWATRGVAANFGRLLMMVPGAAVTGFALNEFRPMTDGEFRTALVFGGVMLLGGYLGPSIKRLSWGKATVETHDRTTLEENRDAATEMTDEVAGSGASVDPDEAIDGARFFAADLAMMSILDSSAFGGADLHVYLFDVDAGGLVPAFGVDDRVSRQPAWRPGVGAVGKAYESGELVVASGIEASDSTHGLDVEQQAQHRDLVAVAAMPIFNATSTVIGVVSASEHDKPVSDCFLTTPEAHDRLQAAADACARILIDLLGWFADDV